MPARGLCAITRPTRLERARRIRPTEQSARRIFVRARPSLSPTTPAARGQRTAVAAEAEAEVAAGVVAVAEAEVVEEVAAEEAEEVAAEEAEAVGVVAAAEEVVVGRRCWWGRRRRWWWRWPAGGRDAQRPALDVALVGLCVVDQENTPGAVRRQPVESRQFDVVTAPVPVPGRRRSTARSRPAARSRS